MICTQKKTYNRYIRTDFVTVLWLI